MVATQELYGAEAAQLASEFWIDELNKLDWLNQDRSALRQITIAAASRLAANIIGDSPNSLRCVVYRENVQVDEFHSYSTNGQWARRTGQDPPDMQTITLRNRRKSEHRYQFHNRPTCCT